MSFPVQNFYPKASYLCAVIMVMLLFCLPIMGLNSNMAYSSFLKGYLLPIYFLD